LDDSEFQCGIVLSKLAKNKLLDKSLSVFSSASDLGSVTDSIELMLYACVLSLKLLHQNNGGRDISKLCSTEPKGDFGMPKQQHKRDKRAATTFTCALNGQAERRGEKITNNAIER